VHENKEKDEIIRASEEEVQQTKSNRESIKEFRVCAEGFRIELYKLTMNMYPNLHVFQQITSYIMV
jgi:hypothetical protein